MSVLVSFSVCPRMVLILLKGLSWVPGAREGAGILEEQG